MDKELVIDLVDNVCEDIQDIIDALIRVNNSPLYRLKEDLLGDEYSVKSQLKNLYKDVLDIKKEIKKGE